MSTSLPFILSPKLPSQMHKLATAAHSCFSNLIHFDRRPDVKDGWSLFGTPFHACRSINTVAPHLGPPVRIAPLHTEITRAQPLHLENLFFSYAYTSSS